MTKTEKECTKCKEIKPVSEFSKQSDKKDGLRSACKSCEKIYRDSYRSLESVKIKKREYEKEYSKQEYVKERRNAQAIERWRNKTEEQKQKQKKKNEKYKKNGKLSEWKKKYRLSEKGKATETKYRQINYNKIANYSKENQKKIIDNLHDCYVRQKLGVKNCSQEIIDLKRIQILIQREIKNVNNKTA